MSMPKVEIKIDASGHVTYSVTEEGVLLTKEQAEMIASRIAELEAENERLRESLERKSLMRVLDQDENDKLREFASEAYSMAFNFYHGAGTAEDLRQLKIEYHELEIEAES